MPAETSKTVGFCECGCGEKTRIARKTRTSLGHVKGQPIRFALGHNRRGGGDPVALFEKYVKRTDTCWLWTGSLSGGRYGQLYVGSGYVVAHRWAYEHFVGPIPDGLEIDHLCRNTRCVNPEHLEPVTRAENTRRTPSTKLTVEAVAEIRASEPGNGMGQRLARKFGVSPRTIYQLRSRSSNAWVAK